MNATTQAVAKPVRRKQEDRRADTRRRVIEATIKCLYSLGYSAVSFSMVAEAAGVSRGIISYHFATKADLMVAVRDAAYTEERAALDKIRAKIGTAAYLEQLPRHVVSGMRREPGIAVNEILLAARGDPELGAKLRATEKNIEERVIGELKSYYAELGFEPPANLAARVRVFTAAFRGLAITDLVQGEDADIEASIDYLTELQASQNFSLTRTAAKQN